MTHKFNLKRSTDFTGKRFLPVTHRLLSQRPPKVDLRGKLPSVFDQGEEGSCGPNSASAIMCYLYPGIKAFSRQQIYYDTRLIEGTVDSDSGVLTKDLFVVLRDKGAAPEALWPYAPSNLITPPPPAVMTEAAKHKIHTYSQLASEEDFLDCLAEGYPFVLGIDVYASFEEDSLATSGVMTHPNTLIEPLLGGHDVTVVGYDRNFYKNPDFIKSHLSESSVSKTALLIRNSWGKDWGLNGHFWMPIDYASSTQTGGDCWTARLAKKEIDMSKPTPAQLEAAYRAGRQALEAYSSFDSSMVPDDALHYFCNAVVNAALNVTEGVKDA